MFKLRVISNHIIKLYIYIYIYIYIYQYRKINIDKQCFYKRSTNWVLATHIAFSLVLFFFFQFKLDKRTVRHDIVR